MLYSLLGLLEKFIIFDQSSSLRVFRSDDLLALYAVLREVLGNAVRIQLESFDVFIPKLSPIS